ncbi:MAG: hypothetical protein IPI15_18110 [Saprospiraceae bacterium]|uniref:hypothetical protein n=1 Tax=Candidatus Brachybacter algidus TaxID=2982024 RepID=UPI00257A64A3|nr:hypothetical protein [Candidatus Brachybacter algidus]MBK7605440.1 hypothetical protein [Candidatus Brachybacter algidus]
MDNCRDAKLIYVGVTKYPGVIWDVPLWLIEMFTPARQFKAAACAVAEIEITGSSSCCFLSIALPFLCKNFIILTVVYLNE